MTGRGLFPLRQKIGRQLRHRRPMELILDTPQNTHRAHKFYEKAGLVKISGEDLPVQYDYPYKDCDFFLLKLCD